MGNRLDDEEEDFSTSRAWMVAEQIEARGIDDAAVLAAMKMVPRECFVMAPFRSFAYADMPLPIPAGQTISQPYVVAYMISALQVKAGDRVLEIGTGSGYAAAVLSRIAREVYTVERHEVLVQYARRRLADLGYDNVWVHHGNGTLGWPEHAPYDAILVSAGGPIVPPSLRRQLAVNGRLVMPVSSYPQHQMLIRLTRHSEGKFTLEKLGPVAFVPLIGVEGWPEVTNTAEEDEDNLEVTSAA
ncbi:MAG TPA: protein-L-isoaspartate(D-aspartate) O-methyltransferase [Anaerolineae bacterium]